MIEDHTLARRSQEADADGARDGYGAARADTLVELVTAGAADHSHRSDCDEDGNEGGTPPPSPDDDRAYLVTVITDADALQGGREESELGECRIQDGPGLAAETARRIACDAAVVTVCETPEGTLLDLGRRRRRPSRALRRALLRRDQHCQFPGCTSRRVQAHHIEHWADGGRANLTNLLSICAFHHRRVHEGGYRVRLDAHGKRHFYHPAGHELVSTGNFEAQQGIGSFESIAPYRSGWDGSRLDLALTLDCLHQHLLHQHLDSAESAVA